jgi:hypothetical protein
MRVRALPAEGQNPDLAEGPWEGQGSAQKAPIAANRDNQGKRLRSAVQLSSTALDGVRGPDVLDVPQPVPG